LAFEFVLKDIDIPMPLNGDSTGVGAAAGCAKTVPVLANMRANSRTIDRVVKQAWI
jgi:hypothetical protein